MISLSPEGSSSCNLSKGTLSLSTAEDSKVPYTYSVKWIPSQISWATRWDNYLHVYDPKIHWFSLINSLLIVFLLTGMVGTIFARSLYRDIARYNSYEDDDDLSEEFGWKLVHADVFRKPMQRSLLAVLVGSGIQILCMSGVIIGI
jgi:transmembrane 9 superfamily protein 2/4